MTPTTLRRIVLVCLALAALVLVLGACAADPVGWNASATHAPLPERVLYVEDVRAACGPYATACAVRDYPAAVCWVYLPRDGGPPDVLAHELKHCAGFTHERYTETPSWSINVR